MATSAAITVLVIDDDQDTRELYSFCLGRVGIRVVEAADGAEALAAAERECPTVALVDLWIPVLDGLEVTRRLRSRASTRSAGIIIVSGALMGHERERALAAGANLFLPKPVDIAQLCQCIFETASRVGFAACGVPGGEFVELTPTL